MELITKWRKKTLSQFLFSAIYCEDNQIEEERIRGLCGTQRRDEKSANKILVRKAEVKILLGMCNRRWDRKGAE
jgi:hypothetical protein